MKFKNVWLEQQFKQVDRRIRVLLSFVDLFTVQKYGKEIIVTDLIRTQSQQDTIYKDNHDYQKKPWSSVHQYGRGADIRTSNLEYPQKMELVELLNKLPYGDGKHKTALFHDIGTGEHIHIQVIGK